MSRRYRKGDAARKATRFFVGRCADMAMNLADLPPVDGIAATTLMIASSLETQRR